MNNYSLINIKFTRRQSIFLMEIIKISYLLLSPFLYWIFFVTRVVTVTFILIRGTIKFLYYQIKNKKF